MGAYDDEALGREPKGCVATIGKEEILFRELAATGPGGFFAAALAIDRSPERDFVSRYRSLSEFRHIEFDNSVCVSPTTTIIFIRLPRVTAFIWMNQRCETG